MSHIYTYQLVRITDAGGRFAGMTGEVVRWETSQIAVVLLDGVLQLVAIHISKLRPSGI